MIEGLWCPIRYRDFYDIPRAVVLEFEGVFYFFSSPFGESEGEYSDYFDVYELSAEATANLDSSDWSSIEKYGKYSGRVSIDELCFDDTKRKSVELRSLRRALESLKMDG